MGMLKARASMSVGSTKWKTVDLHISISIIIIVIILDMFLVIIQASIGLFI